MKVYPTKGNVILIADDLQGMIQYSVAEISMPVDFTNSVKQFYFLNEQLIIQVHEMKIKLEELEHKMATCEQTQMSHLANVSHETQQLAHQ